MECHDPYETCPYNEVHRIRRSRMQCHVATCGKNSGHAGLERCPFDARHVIKKNEFEHHKRTCPARGLVLDYAIYDKASELKILPIDVNPVGQCDEDWDAGADVKTYNPLKNIENKPIVYPLIGASKAERKNHRMKEQLRYKRVIENIRRSVIPNSFDSTSESADYNWNSKNRIDCDTGDIDDEQDYIPLRQPKQFLGKDSIGVIKIEAPKSTLRKNSEMSLKVDEISNDSSNFMTASLKNQTDFLSNEEVENYCKLKTKLSNTQDDPVIDGDYKKMFITDRSSKDFSQNENPLLTPSVSDNSKILSKVDKTSKAAESFVKEDNIALHNLSKSIEGLSENDNSNDIFMISDTASMYEDLATSSLSYDETSSDASSCTTALMKNHSSTLINRVEDESVFEKLSKTIEEMIVSDKSFYEKSKALDKQIEMLKKSKQKSKKTADFGNEIIF